MDTTFYDKQIYNDEQLGIQYFFKEIDHPKFGKVIVKEYINKYTPDYRQQQKIGNNIEFFDLI